MARFYLDEQIEADLTALLIQYGHDALHTHDAGNDGAPDTRQLLFAANSGRILVTLNRIVRCPPSFPPPFPRKREYGFKHG